MVLCAGQRCPTSRREEVEALCRQHKVGLLYVFGSRSAAVRDWVAGGDGSELAGLRRSLEALLDLGRHILAKGFGVGVTEYKEIASELCRHGVLTEADAALLRTLAGYRR